MTDSAPADAAPSPPRRGRLLRALAIAGVAFVVLGAVGLVARNALLRGGMETAVTAATGFPLEVESVDLGLLNARLAVGGLHLKNPEGFPEPTCLRIGEMVADPDLGSLFGDTVRVEELALDVGEVVVVRKADGETNLDRLRALGGGGGKGDGGPPAEGDGGGAGRSRPSKKVRIDLLRLGIGRVRMVDYSSMKDGKPSERVWELGIREEFRDLDSPEKVVRVVVLRVLQKTNIRLLAASAESLVDGLGGVITGTGEQIGALLKGIPGGDRAAEGIGDAIKGAKDALGGLLGK